MSHTTTTADTSAANPLPFSLLAFLLLRAVWRACRGFAPTRLANTVLILQLAATLIAVLLHLLPGTMQQNQPWIMYALPVWATLAWSLRQRPLPHT